VETWQISGVLIASTQADIRTAAALLQSYYAVQNQFLGLYHDDGTLSHCYLDPSVAQVRVVSLRFPVGKGGGEYATGRHYEITVESTYPALIGGILAFQEQLSFQGNGGPKYAYFELMQGPPIRQIASNQTLFRATQSGTAIGQLAYPDVPSPLWPSYLDGSTSSVTKTGGNFVSGYFTGFGVSWNYQFTSDQPFYGEPTLT